MDRDIIIGVIMLGFFLLLFGGAGVYYYLQERMKHQRELLRMEKGLPPTPVVIEHYLCDDCDCENKK